ELHAHLPNFGVHWHMRSRESCLLLALCGRSRQRDNLGSYRGIQKTSRARRSHPGLGARRTACSDARPLARPSGGASHRVVCYLRVSCRGAGKRRKRLVPIRIGGIMMGVRLAVMSEGVELSAVETETEDDFMYFRDSVCMALEGNDFGSGFPVFQRKFFSDWDADEVVVLERELSRMHADMRKLPPKPLDSNWASKLAVSGRQPETLAEVFI